MESLQRRHFLRFEKGTFCEQQNLVLGLVLGGGLVTHPPLDQPQMCSYQPTWIAEI